MDLPFYLCKISGLGRSQHRWVTPSYVNAEHRTDVGVALIASLCHILSSWLSSSWMTRTRMAGGDLPFFLLFLINTKRSMLSWKGVNVAVVSTRMNQ